MGRALVHRIGNAVGQNQAPLRIGVDDLDGFAARAGHDIARLDRLARRHVLGRRNNADDIDLGLELGDRQHGADHGCAAAHVRFHLLHIQGRLDRDPTAVERDALADERQRRATASRAPIFKRRMSSMSSTLASRPVALVASLTLSANMLGVNAFAGVFTHSRIRLVASVRTMASLTAADAARSPLSPRIVSDSTGATALSCLVLSDPASKLLSPIPSVAARARSAVSALAATSLGSTSASRRWPRRRRVRPAACSALRSRTMSSCSTLPTPTSTVHRLGRVLRLWIGTSSMNLPRNSRSLSNCSMAPLSFLSRATA